MKHVTIEFDSDEKAQAFFDYYRRNSPDVIRWDQYDDDAYDYIDVVKIEDAPEEA